MINSNWDRELKKWLGVRLSPLVLESSTDAGTMKTFALGHATQTPVLLLSYEMMRKHQSALNDIESLDLIILDEAHRFLKNSSGTKTSAALGACKATKRLILTGTPLQNSLDELYAVVSFVAPRLFGSLGNFKRQFETPILRGKSEGASEKDITAAAVAAELLRKRLSSVMIRRTSHDLESGGVEGVSRTNILLYLPLADNQRALYDKVAKTILSPLKPIHSRGDLSDTDSASGGDIGGGGGGDG